MHTCWEKLLVRGTMWSNFLPKLLMELLFSFFFLFFSFCFPFNMNYLPLSIFYFTQMLKWEKLRKKKGFAPGISIGNVIHLGGGKYPLIWAGWNKGNQNILVTTCWAVSFVAHFFCSHNMEDIFPPGSKEVGSLWGGMLSGPPLKAFSISHWFSLSRQSYLNSSDI